ncbi:hypothetical protein BJX99DRAFT_203235 [Aspergillus californicus]
MVDFDGQRAGIKEGNRARRRCISTWFYLQPALSPPIPVPFLFIPAFQSPMTTKEIPLSRNMLPTFHMNSFKPWAPSPTKPFLPHKIPHACTPRPPGSPSPGAIS